MPADRPATLAVGQGICQSPRQDRGWRRGRAGAAIALADPAVGACVFIRSVPAHIAVVSIVCLFALHLAIYWPFLAFTHWLHPASPPVAMRQHEWVLAGVDCLFVAVLSAFWSFACLDLGSMRVRRMVIDMLLSDAAEVLPAYITAAFIHVREQPGQQLTRNAEQDRRIAQLVHNTCRLYAPRETFSSTVSYATSEISVP